MVAGLSYESGRERFADFFQTFCVTDENCEKRFVYAEQIRQLTSRTQVPMYIDLGDLETHDEELYKEVRHNTARYATLVYEVVDKLIKEQLGINPVSFSFCEDLFNVPLASCSRCFGCLHLPKSLFGGAAKKQR